MIVDANLQFSDAQSLTATAASTNSIDLKQDRDIGVGYPMWLVVQSLAAPGGTTPTIAISLETDDSSSYLSVVTAAASPTLSAAQFALGTIYAMPWPRSNERHNRLKYTLGGTSPTFTVTAFLTSEPPPGWQALPAANLA